MQVHLLYLMLSLFSLFYLQESLIFFFFFFNNIELIERLWPIVLQVVLHFHFSVSLFLYCFFLYSYIKQIWHEYYIGNTVHFLITSEVT